MSDHEWPSDPAEHVWGPWIINTSVQPGKPATQYHSCVHPSCTAVEYRQAPR